ncbi:hypothetical protein HLH10_14775 [Acinetobacter sp. ANC 4277]|uniref:hypothetical protein n=1 Tax=Acinetobacter terrae TaxID=2731247 RepID=UPI00148FF2DA|nr:hypothetical protein [Acinetobacter terrae]NNG77501.1 hypothetical protein [Acinetobacter terrae]
MSQERYSEYLYFTISQDSNQSAQEIVTQYQLDQMQGELNFWDKNQLNDEHTHKFEKICIRFEIGDVEYLGDFSQQIFYWLHLFKRKTKVQSLSGDFTKSLHLVIHGTNSQNSGFHLNHQLIRVLNELSIEFSLHSYWDAEDGQDFPFSTPVIQTQPTPKFDEYAYFEIRADELDTKELQQLLPVLNLTTKLDQGKNPRSQRVLPNSTTSILELKSTLNAEHNVLEQHIQNILKKLIPYQSELQRLFFNGKINLSIKATGHLENPHHRRISAQTIQQLFALGLSLDVDYYFAS